MVTHLVYITAASKAEALSMARTLVEEKLVACANIVSEVTSIYRWENAVQESPEVIMIAKTIASQVPRVVERVKQLHNYECPCIVAIPVTEGNRAFFEWVEHSVND